MPTTPHYQFIAIARTIARGFTEQAPQSPGDAEIEAARAIEVLEGMEWRKRPGEARTMKPMRRTLSDGTGLGTRRRF